MDNREHCLLLRRWHKDELTASSASRRYHTSAGATSRTSIERCIHHGTSAGAKWPLRNRYLADTRQYLLAAPFLRANASGYLSRAFEFSRQFLFKWTVNWRFMGEEVFLSREFAITQAICNISGLLLFLSTRWTIPSGLSLTEIAGTLIYPLRPEVQQPIARRITSSFISTSILTSMVVGLLFARTLHYQFYSYIAWSSPFLLWKSGLHPVLIYSVWIAQEWAWNVYPSTDISSMVVVGCLAIQVSGVWWGTREEFQAKAHQRPATRNAIASHDSAS